MVFDDEFTTICHKHESKVPPNWKELVENVWLREYALDPSDLNFTFPLSTVTSSRILTSSSVSERLSDSPSESPPMAFLLLIESLLYLPHHFQREILFLLLNPQILLIAKEMC